MTEKEKILGLELAKLQLKVHRQRVVINQRGLSQSDPIVLEAQQLAREVSRQNDGLRRQITRLQTENRALRIYIAEQKIPSKVRLWLGL